MAIYKLNTKKLCFFTFENGINLKTQSDEYIKGGWETFKTLTRCENYEGIGVWGNEKSQSIIAKVYGSDEFKALTNLLKDAGQYSFIYEDKEIKLFNMEKITSFKYAYAFDKDGWEQVKEKGFEGYTIIGDWYIVLVNDIKIKTVKEVELYEIIN